MNNQLKARIFSFFVIFSMLLSALGMPTIQARAATITFTGQELLGRPTNNSITISVVPDSAASIFYDYGTTSGVYPNHTTTGTATGGTPYVVTISGLTADTQYYYRMQYSTDSGSTWTQRAEHTFRTQRASGDTFTFDVTSDSHVNIQLGSSSIQTQTFTNVAADHPDFMIDLGDTFAMDSVSTVAAAETAYKYQLQYFNLVSHSSAIYLAVGNHEEQEGWHLDDTSDPTLAMPIIGTNAEKKFYLNPVPNSFYSGDSSTYATLGGDGLREDYYAWTWGDALFVVIDPFWFTMTKPFTGNTGGGETSDTGSGDRWDWTLGLTQFNWLKTTLQNSTSKYKFVLAHHYVGGSDDYVRGGANPENIVGEWGGWNEDGTTWGWDTHRPVADWGSEPVRQILEDYHVSAFIHGHDHEYAYEKRNGVVYQEVPSGGFTGAGFGLYTTGNGYTIQAINSPGHLRYTVSPTQTTVDYIASGTTDGSKTTVNGASRYSYTIAPYASGTTHVLTTAVSPSSSGTISPAAGGHTYNAGDVVSVTATPNTGYTFSSWSGACTGSGTCSVTMDADKTVTANFTTVTTYTLTTGVSPSAGGTISPATGPFNSGAAVNVTATANSGYVLGSWSGTGACSGTTNPCAVTMSAARSITANFVVSAADPITFTGTELLGRPEADRISISAVPDSAATIRYQYSTTSGGSYTNSSSVAATAGTPAVVSITGLSANTKYYYRMQYSTDGGANWTSRTEKSFRTQRAIGSTFTFDITSDSHVNIQLGNSSNWTSTLNEIAADAPDFQIDLGDTAAMDNGSSSVTLGDTASAEQKYKDILPFFNIVSGSSPLFLVAGNHEQQEGWHLQGTLANSLPVMGKNAEKKYFLNPVPDSFYTGDTSTLSALSGDQLKQDYYAWTWGDALFVVISPFWTTTTKPYTTSAGGGETDATGSGNRWDWTLGLTQFNWLKTTLQNSSAKYKFVFGHQIVGGNGMTSPVNQVNYGHGGVDSANYVEWGGYDTDGTTYTWSTNRSGWGTQPIRQMMEANGVTAFFHGHDHQDAQEKLNSIVYQSVPSGSFTGSFGNYTTGGNSGNTIWADSTQGAGYLRVTVAPSQTTVDFIRYNSTSVANTYTMAPNAATNYTLTANNDGHGTVTLNPSGGTYASGTTVTLTPVASSGYQFSSWSGTNSGDVINTSGVYTIVMNGNKTVQANFSQITYTLTANNDGHGTVTLNPSGGTYATGTTVTLTPVPGSGYHFNTWSGTNSGDIINTSGVYTIVMNANKSVTANFTLSNVAPVANADTYTAEKNSTMTIDAPGVLGNDTDANTDPLTASKLTDPGHGAVTLNANGSFTYTPTAGYTGDDTFTYRASDGALYSSSATVTIHINDATPPAVPSSFYGYINITTNPPVAGDLVQAYVPGAANPVASTAILNTSPLTYAIDVPGDKSGTSMVEGGTEGGLVTFKINGHVVATSTWHTGTSVQLDFNVLSHSLALVTGWNLVSLNIHPTSSTITDVLAPISGNYSLVFAWDASTSLWKKYDPSVPFGNTLTSLDETMGFWIKMSSAQTLTISGSAPVTTNHALKTGWNLVGYPSMTNRALPDVFSLHGVGTDFSLVYAYHASDTDFWKKYDRSAPFGNDLTELAPDYGYWIKIGADHTWDVGY